MTRIDQYHEGRAVIEHMKAEGLLPEQLMSHTAMSEDSLEKLTGSQFADRRNRQWPVCNRNETALSLLTFEAMTRRASVSIETVKERDNIRGILRKAAGLFGLDEKKLAHLSKSVNLEKVFDDGPAEPAAILKLRGRTAEIRTAEDCAAAAADLTGNLPRLGEKEKREASSVVLRAASALGWQPPADVQDLLHRAAGVGTCRKDTAVEIADRVRRALPYHAAREDTVLQALVQGLDEQEGTVLTPETVDRVAEALDTVQNRYYLSPDRRVDLSDLREITPDMMRQASVKKADRVRLPGGLVCSRAHIEKNAELIGNTLANTVEFDGHTPDEIIDKLQRMTPLELTGCRDALGV